MSTPTPSTVRAVLSGALTLHGWHYLIEDGEVRDFDVQGSGFILASRADNAGTGPYRPVSYADDLDGMDASGVPASG